MFDEIENILKMVDKEYEMPFKYIEKFSMDEHLLIFYPQFFLFYYRAHVDKIKFCIVVGEVGSSICDKLNQFFATMS